MRIKILNVLTSLFLVTVATTVHAEDDLAGIWKSKGYGYYFQFNQQQVGLYEFTQISCLRSGLQTGSVSYSNNRQAARFSVTIPGFINADMMVNETPDANKKRVHRTDTNTYFTIERVNQLPQECRKSTHAPTDFVEHVFTQNFIEHYAFLNHDSVLKKLTKPSSTSSNNTNLFKNLVDKVSAFKDPHIAIVSPSTNQYYFGNEQQNKPIITISPAHLQNALFNQVGDTNLNEALNQKLIYGKLTKDIGYLAVKGFSEFKPGANIDAESRELNTVLDRIFTSLSSVSSLIIDVRNNTGGSDKLALQLAARLTQQPYFAYAKQAVADTSKKIVWTKANASEVEPTTRPSYYGKVVLLTNRQTISAGETFVMATMEREPHITRIGEPTAGHFSDMLPRTLPNAWLFALPNERFIDSQGKSYDHSGIPAHITAQDSKQDDKILLRALSYLTSMKSGT